MWALHTKNSAHWIPIAVLASFKRMEPFKHYGVPWVAEVLRERSQELLEVDAKGENVRRKTELLPPGMQSYDNSVYAVSRLPRRRSGRSGADTRCWLAERVSGHQTGSAGGHREVLRSVRACGRRPHETDRR